MFFLALNLPLSGSAACIKSAQQKQDSGRQRQEGVKGSAGDYLNKQPGRLLLLQSCALPAPFAESFIKFVLMPRLISVFFSDLVLKRNSISNGLNKLLLCKTHYGEELLRCRDTVSSAVENWKAGSSLLMPAVEEKALPSLPSSGSQVAKSMHICGCACVYAHMCVYVCVNVSCICAYECVCSVCIYVYVYECVFLCMHGVYVSVYMCACVYVRVYV